MLEGPTGPVGNFSLIMVSECQVDYLIAGLDFMEARGLAALVSREEAFAEFHQVQEPAGAPAPRGRSGPHSPGEG